MTTLKAEKCFHDHVHPLMFSAPFSFLSLFLSGQLIMRLSVFNKCCSNAPEAPQQLPASGSGSSSEERSWNLCQTLAFDTPATATLCCSQLFTGYLFPLRAT